MALIATLTTDRSLRARLEAVTDGRHALAWTASRGGLRRMVRERPVSATLVDLDAAGPDTLRFLGAFRRDYPNTGLVVVGAFEGRPLELFRLGRARLDPLILLGDVEVEAGARRALAHALSVGVAALVTARLSRFLPRRELVHVHTALDRIDLAWSAEAFASHIGLTRPVLSERLKGVGLPSVGRLLLWSRLFHAGHWLVEPGRTAESVSRQLGYSSGAAFRRALKLCTGRTPTEIREEGGLAPVLDRFLDAHGFLEGTSWDRAHVA